MTARDIRFRPITAADTEFLYRSTRTPASTELAAVDWTDPRRRRSCARSSTRNTGRIRGRYQGGDFLVIL